MKVEVAVRGSPSLISRTLFVDVKHLQKKEVVLQTLGTTVEESA